MKNRTFGDLQGESLSDASLKQSTAQIGTTLTEPQFQDLSNTSRFFVDYCELSSCLAPADAR